MTLYLKTILYKIEKCMYLLQMEKREGSGWVELEDLLLAGLMCQLIPSEEMPGEQSCISSQPEQTTCNTELGKVSIQNEIALSSLSNREN